MLYFIFIVLSIWFNHIWLVNNETFVLAIFLIAFFILLYIIMNFFIKIFLLKNVNNILNLLKYTNTLDLYSDKILYYNLMIKNKFFKNLLKIKNKSNDLFYKLNYNISNFLFLNILNFFLVLKKNLFKIFKNKKFFIFKYSIKECEILL